MGLTVDKTFFSGQNVKNVLQNDNILQNINFKFPKVIIFHYAYLHVMSNVPIKFYRYSLSSLLLDLKFRLSCSAYQYIEWRW